MFGEEESLTRICQLSIHEIVNTTLLMCAKLNVIQELSEKSDVVEGFFSMLSQIFKKNPQILQTSNLDMAALFQCGEFFILFHSLFIAINLALSLSVILQL